METNLFDPFGGCHGKFDYENLSNRIKKLKEELKIEFGVHMEK